MPTVDLTSVRQQAAWETLPAIARAIGSLDADVGTLRDASLILMYRTIVERLRGFRAPEVEVSAGVARLFRRSAHERFGTAHTLIDNHDPDRARIHGAVDALLEGIDAATVSSRFLGAIHETTLQVSLVRSPHVDVVASRDRKIAGAFYTPENIIERVLDRAVRPVLAASLERWRRAPERELELPRVLDPAMGSGHVLVAAAGLITRELAEALRRSPRPPAICGVPVDASEEGRALASVIRECIHGVDVDPFAVELARASLWLETEPGTLDPSELDERLVCMDAVEASLPSEENGRGAPAWRRAFPHVFGATGGFDAVIGNPPFQSQLSSTTVRSRALAASLRERHAGSTGAYTDTAAMFLLIGMHLVRDGGMVCLVQPQSVLGSRDGAGVRRACEREGRLTSLWIAGKPIFEDTSVLVCAPCLRRGDGGTGTIEVSIGEARVASLKASDADVGGAWSELISVARGVPACRVDAPVTVGDVADATADFRDQYYDVRDHVLEQGDVDPSTRVAPLLTTGLIDLAECRWGERPARYARRAWTAPVVDLDGLSDHTRHGRWAAQRLVPKIVVATQTRVIELVVDEAGRYLPMTPLITVTPHKGTPIWALGAAIASPAGAAIAHRLGAGTALSADAIKLSASQVRMLPVPDLSSDRMRLAADALREASDATDPADRTSLLRRMGALTCHAFGVSGDELLDWWSDRLVPGRDRRPASAC